MSAITRETMDGQILHLRPARPGEPTHRVPHRIFQRWVAAEQVCWALLDTLDISRGCDPATSRADNARLEQALRSWHALVMEAIDGD